MMQVGPTDNVVNTSPNTQPNISVNAHKNAHTKANILNLNFLLIYPLLKHIIIITFITVNFLYESYS